ncbi:MAG: uracil-DNA glycosylase [Hyphomicrobiales bacterium]
MTKIDPKIEESWKIKLIEEFNKEYFINLKNFLSEEIKKCEVYPPGSKMFTAFELTPYDDVKVVILGQDPYHGPGQAHGLSFSVPEGIQQPPSLKNILKELKEDLNIEAPKHGNLEKWAKQGVLLLNATLTVRARNAGSHQNKGWETFTDSIIQMLNKDHDGLVFILWGNYAKQKQKMIDSDRHHIITCVHPSPLSAHRGFFGSKPFSETNNYLETEGKDPIDWSL